MQIAWRSLVLVAVFTGALITPPPSNAQQTGASRSSFGRMDTNLYIGGSVGQAYYRNACEGINGSCDENDTAWKAFAGYQFHRNIAVEAGYFNLGKLSATHTVGAVTATGDIKASGWEIVGVGILPLTNEFSLYGKLGVARTTLKGNATAALGRFSATTSGTDRSTDLTFGLGGSYSFTRNIAARLEWQRYSDVGGDNVGQGDIDAFTAGVLWKF